MVVVAISFLLMPGWVSPWLNAVGETKRITMALMPFGQLVLLSALRWKRRDGRLLVAMAVVPHSTNPYDMLYPLTVAHSTREASMLAALSWVAFVGPFLLSPRAPYVVWMRTSAWLALVLLYLPATWLVLRRPNVASHVRNVVPAR